MSAKQYFASVYKCILGCGPLRPGHREVSSCFLWMLGFALPHQLFLCSLVPLFILETYKQPGPWEGQSCGAWTDIIYAVQLMLSRAAVFRATRRTAKCFLVLLLQMAAARSADTAWPLAGSLLLTERKVVASSCLSSWATYIPLPPTSCSFYHLTSYLVSGVRKMGSSSILFPNFWSCHEH